ncbi:MAG: type III secretion system chaperone [Pseudomonadota bacterium]
MNCFELIKRFFDELGLTEMFQVDKDIYSFLFNDQYQVNIEIPHQSSRFFIYTKISSAPNQSILGQVQWLKTLFKAQFFGQETGVAWFTLQPETEDLYLMTGVEKNDISYEYFTQVLETFLQSVELWIEKTKSMNQNELTDFGNFDKIASFNSFV